MKYNFSSLVPGSIGGYMTADSLLNAMLPDGHLPLPPTNNAGVDGYMCAILIVKAFLGFLLAVYGPSMKDVIERPVRTAIAKRRKRRARKQAAK